MSGTRLTSGGLIDRSRTLSFRFDGLPMRGHPGDTLASALVANGVRVVGRSFKYHRPRGVWGAWFDDPSGIVNIRLDGAEFPNCLAAITPLLEGMDARAVNAFPNARFDVKSVLDRAHRFLPAGFYYKTFMWPDWHLFEPSIRKMAGLGDVARTEFEGFEADQRFDACDVLIVGGGVAGLTAAREAVRIGQKVVLVDDHPEMGGAAFHEPTIDGTLPARWVQDIVADIKAGGGQVLNRTTAFGIYDHQLVSLVQETGFGTAPRLIKMRAKRCILATGALDRPMIFGNNDRPGVMSLHGACEYLSRYGVLVGQQIAVLASHSLAKTQADQLCAAGAEVTMVDPNDAQLEAMGRFKLRALRCAKGKIACDTILTSAGIMPLVHLWRHAGGKLDWDAQMACFRPGAGPDWITCVGAANGTIALDDVRAEAASIANGTEPKPARSPFRATPPKPHLGAKRRQWIDLQHDVTLKDVELAAQENYASVEHLKRYTALGMASDQGKTSNVPGLAAMAAIQGKTVPQVGTTTFRPPFVPIPLETYRGAHRAQHLAPLKRLPLEQRHRAAGAALGEYGGWLRPGWYGADDPKMTARAEALMARQSAGIFDASPLGKIEVMGPDAAAFMDFMYYNTMSTLTSGHIRYGFMLTEGGIVMDDGVVARLADDRFVVSCSSSHVASVTAALELWRQDGHNPDRIFVHDTTQHWGTVTVSGPRARDIVSALQLDLDVSADALPHMRFAEVQIDRTPIRVARVSFTGDLSFELSIRASRVEMIWDTVIAAALPFDAGPIGLEAVSILRAEKGYLIIGKDTDGETMPHDLGFGGPRTKKTAPFVGDRSLHTDNAARTNRRRLVGLASDTVLPVGAHVIEHRAGAPVSLGFVSSSYASPNTGGPIALGLVEAGVSGEVVLQHLGQTFRAQIVSPCFFDPEGTRLHA